MKSEKEARPAVAGALVVAQATGLAPMGYAHRVKVPGPRDAERSRDAARRAASDNTRRAYSSDWRIFEAWCAMHQVPSLPCTEQTLCEFNLARLDSGCSIRTVSRGVVSIRAKQTLSGFDDPWGTYAKLNWTGLRKQWYTNPNQAAPLYGDAMARVIDAMDMRRLYDMRSRAILLVGLCGAMRRSEIVGLRVEDVTFNAEGMEITLRRSKTDQIGKGFVKPYRFATTRHCPVLAMKAWLLASNIREGFVFQTIRRRRMTGKALAAGEVCSMVQKMTAKAGVLPPKDRRFSGHSMRSGFMTRGHEAGIPLESLMMISGHTSREQAAGYIRQEPMKQSLVDVMAPG